VTALALPLRAGRVRVDPESVRPALCEVLVGGRLACSGFFVDDRGTCMTCAHALAGNGEKTELLLADGRRVAATRGGVNRAGDSAVLLAQLGEGEKVAFLELAEETPGVGEAVVLAGTPVYRHGLFLTGHVAARRHGFEYNRDLKTYVQVFYVSAMAPGGTSGGPWLNEGGEVVGLQSGGLAKGSTLWGVAFVVPARVLGALAAEPARDVPAGDLGAAVEELWEQPADTIRRFAPQAEEGLVLRHVLEGGPCHRSGLANGGLIVAVEGRPCRFRDDLLRVVRARRPGDTLGLEVVRERGGELDREAVVVTLGDAADAARLRKAPGETSG
jgi:S1-C subfamily serine protease